MYSPIILDNFKSVLAIETSLFWVFVEILLLLVFLSRAWSIESLDILIRLNTRSRLTSCRGIAIRVAMKAVDQFETFSTTNQHAGSCSFDGSLVLSDLQIGGRERLFFRALAMCMSRALCLINSIIISASLIAVELNLMTCQDAR